MPAERVNQRCGRTGRSSGG